MALSYANEAAPDVIVQDTMVNSVILDGHEDMAGYAHAFDALRSAALTPGQSIAFIRNIMNGIAEEKEEA